MQTSVRAIQQPRKPKTCSASAMSSLCPFATSPSITYSEIVLAKMGFSLRWDPNPLAQAYLNRACNNGRLIICWKALECDPWFQCGITKDRLFCLIVQCVCTECVGNGIIKKDVESENSPKWLWLLSCRCVFPMELGRIIKTKTKRKKGRLRRVACRIVVQARWIDVVQMASTGPTTSKPVYGPLLAA
jgi:hypothetical protein